MEAVALLLPGQGAQHGGMAVELYGGEPLFAEVMDALFGQLGEEGARLRALWLSGESGAALDEGSVAQPLLFAIGYAVGRCLEGYGIRPVAYLGHSVGELAAAALAGVFGADGAAAVMAARARAMGALPAGGMLAVAAAPDRLAEFTDPLDRADGVVVGAHNAALNSVLAGPEPRLTEVGLALREAGIAWRPVPARQPFHSPAARPAAEVFRRELAGLPLRAPHTPVWSTRTGRPVRAAEAVDPGFWAGQLAAPVLFREALDALLGSEPLTVVDSGPSQSSALFARRHPVVRKGGSAVLPLMPAGGEGTLAHWREALERLGAARPAAEPIG
uniref:SsfV n=1 Tax=Streptomyces sp. SF2575 TaxID=746675 RepID=D6MSU7_9ACTN|nr:SsfV [Streptomyces sp. SF2575]